MKPNDEKASESIQEQPGHSDITNLPQGKALQESPGEHPDQAGAEFGGYGHTDSRFGREPGSSSVEGGQGAGEDAAPVEQADAQAVPKTLPGGTDGSQPPAVGEPPQQAAGDQGYRRDERYGGFVTEHRTQAAPQQQDAPEPNKNHQDQGGQRKG